MRPKVASNPVVITGIAGRFPESNNIDEFWANLLSGKELCTEDDRRWPVGYRKLPKKAGKIPTLTKFDAQFFNIPSRRADEMGADFRICHETTFEAILDAGMNPVDISGPRTGMLIGYCMSDTWYAKTEDASCYDSEWFEVFSEVSKNFRFEGPCTTHDSACASSFSAFNEAVMLIQANVIDTAIVAGVGVCCAPQTAGGFMQLGMTSPDGRSKCMDKNANGYVRSETIGSIVLQRQSDAKRVYAVVVNVATNSDGFKTEGITFPGQQSMERLMRETYEDAGLDPKDTKYIEGHVTGTQAGDPVECKSIESVFCPEDRKDAVLIGCLKSNMGHSEGPSGIAAITKACLIMQRKIIPPNINYTDANPNIPGLFNGKIKPVLSTTPFEGTVISLNSFGFGGTNVHLIIKANTHSVNQDIDKITGLSADQTPINRLVLYKCRTEQGFEILETQFRDNPDQITTEFLALIDNIATLDSTYQLSYRGYFILDQDRKITKCAWSKLDEDANMASEHEESAIILDDVDLKASKWKGNFLKSVGLKVIKNINKDTQNKAEDASYSAIRTSEIKSYDDALSVIGRLFIEGNDEIKLHSLYPKIQFPVSASTASISPLIRWNHDIDRRVYLVPEYFRYATNSKSFKFDYAGNYNFLTGHVIDGRVLFPASGYLWIIWHSLALELIENSPEAYLKSGVEFKNVKLHRATMVNSSEEITLRASLNSLTGRFEITQSGVIIATGHAQLTYNQDVASYQDNTDQNAEKIPGRDFYRELRVRGYDYEETFQGVTASNQDGKGGHVTFIKHWICFCDAIFQLSLLSDKTRQLLLPTGFERLQVSLATFDKLTRDQNANQGVLTEIIDGKETLKGAFDVKIDPITKEVFAEGLYMKGMKADAAPRRKVAPQLRKYQFHPFDEMLEEHTHAQKIKSEYTEAILASLNASGQDNADRNKDNADQNQDNADSSKTLLSVIKNITSEENAISFDNLSVEKYELSKDILLQLPADKIAFDHQLDIVVSTFHRRQLSVSEINLSYMSSVEDQVRKSIIYSSPEVNYTTIPDFQELINTGAGKPIKIDSELVIIQHPTLNFSFLDNANDNANNNRLSTDAIKLACNKIKSGAFIMLIMRQGMTLVEETISALMKINRCQQSADEITNLIRASGLIVISTKIVGSVVYILSRKVDAQVYEKTPNLINIDTFNYAWVDALRDKMYSKCEDAEKNVYLVGREMNGLTGFMNCVRFEDKRFRGILILDKDADDEEIIRRCLSYDLNLSAYKDRKLGTFFHSRLSDETVPKQFSVSKTSDTNQASRLEKALVLDVETKGDLSSLKYYETRIHNSDSVRDIHYSALNFKDIMVASGRVPVTAYPETLRGDERGDLGMEFSGTDKNGNRVMAFIPSDAIATKIDISASKDFVWSVPDWMTLEDAATIPVVYSTVYYALIMRGKLIAQESVLIHAGSGGVGQAAINICLSMNCEIFTTVGTPEKREFIKKKFGLSDAHIFDSRSVSFGDDLLRATDGRGVDLILNSLSEEKLQVGVTCLANSGRFIEIGKYDMINDSAFDPAHFRMNQTFESVCLAFFMSKVMSDKCGNDPQAKMLRNLIDAGLKSGVVKPLSRHVFDWNQAEDAFRFMASGKHVGKVLMKMRGEDKKLNTDAEFGNLASKRKVSFDTKKSFIVIGGLGGFGLEICDWLVKKGVRYLIITSRSGVQTSYQRFCINRMKNNGARVEVVTYDVSNHNQASELIKFASSIAPVGGVFNLGMVLKDSLFENQTCEMFEEVCRVKIRGTNNLDEITRRRCPNLDHFVCFSSLASSVGHAGQANYAFANASMELICETRKKAGLPALAIGWGAIGDAGHVAENLGHDVELLGSIPQRIHSCLEVLERIIYARHPIIGCFVPSVNKSSVGSDSDLLSGILNVLGIKDQSKTDANSTLGDLGLDSLMAVEIKQILEKKFDIVYSTKEIRDLKIDAIKGFSKGACPASSSIVKDRVEDKTEKRSIEVASNQDLIILNLPTKIFEQLIPNQDSVDADTVFIIPPIEGSFINMTPMLEVLSKKLKRQLIGVNWVESNDDHDSVQEIASFYLAKIREQYPNLKQYDLIAYSFGTLIALEMAIQSHDSVINLIMLDCSPIYARHLLLDNHDAERNTWLDIFLNYVNKSIRLGTLKLDEKITKLPDDDAEIVRLVTLVKRQSGNKISDSVFIESIDRIRRKIRMIKEYEPRQRLNQDVKLIRATGGFTSLTKQEASYDYDLSKHISGTVSVVQLEGDHKSFLSINADKIADEITNALIPLYL